MITDQITQDKIVVLSKQGISSRLIAKQLNIHEQTVARILSKNGIVLSELNKIKQQETKEKCLKLYNEGSSINELAKQFNMSKNTLRPYIKANAIHFRESKEAVQKSDYNKPENILTRSKNTRTYSLNETKFSDLEDEETAYWIGFIYADGHISKKGYKIQIGLAKKDYDHLVKFCNYLEMDIKKIRFSESNNATYVIINSYTLHKKFLDLGISNRKSYDGIPPKELENNKHFWRGVVDGDGSLFKSKKRKIVDLTGNENTCNSFKMFFNINNKLSKKSNSIATFSIRKDDNDLKISSLLYKDSKIYLDRKYKIYQEWVNTKD